MENKINIDSYSADRNLSARYGSENVVYVTEPVVDEIDLGDLIRRLTGEWKFIALVLVGGLLLSMLGSFVLTRSYMVEAIIRLPNINEIGDISDQRLLEVTPEVALERFLDQLNRPENQVEVFEKSALFTDLSDGSLLSPSQIFKGIREKLSVSRIKHPYYELDKAEKTPFKEVGLSLASSRPKLAAEFIQALIYAAQEKALSELTGDIAALKENRIRDIKERLNSLTLAANASRMAEISRLEETNRELIASLQMQIGLQISRAKKNRENQIIRVEEALSTAQALNITDPVTWDDLRTKRTTSQITNEFGGEDKSTPHYFQGARILSAELKRLKSRQDDRPFIHELVELEKQIEVLEKDPKIAALKLRKDDTIYIEQFDKLQQELSRLNQVPTQYNNARLAIVSQSAVVAPEPTRSSLMIILVGVFISGFLGLFIALIRISLLKREPLKSAV